MKNGGVGFDIDYHLSTGPGLKIKRGPVWTRKKKERKIDRVLYMNGMAKESPVGSGPSFASSVAHVTHRKAQLRNVYGLCHFWSFLYRREKQNKWVRKNEKKFKSKERKELSALSLFWEPSAVVITTTTQRSFHPERVDATTIKQLFMLILISTLQDLHAVQSSIAQWKKTMSYFS